MHKVIPSMTEESKRFAQESANTPGVPKLDARELRHAYATMPCEAGIDLKSIGTTMGHTKVSTTEIYIGTPEIDRLKSIRNAGIDYILK